MTPAAVSKSIRALEKDLGFALVAPEGRGLVVTDRGRLVADRAERLLRSINALYDPDSLAGADDGTIRLGTCSWYASFMYAELVRRLPHADIALVDASPMELEGALAERRIDLAVFSATVARPHLRYERLGRMPMGVYARAELIAAHAPHELPFAVHGATSAGGEELHGGDGWPAAPHERRIAYRVGSTATVFELCRQGLAAAYIPVFVAELHNRDARPTQRLAQADIPRLRRARSWLEMVAVSRSSDIEGRHLDTLAEAVTAICTQSARKT